MPTHVIQGDKAHVLYNHDRAFWALKPWVAVWDGYDPTPIDHETAVYNPVGEGNTEQEALDDLIDQSHWLEE